MSVLQRCPSIEVSVKRESTVVSLHREIEYYCRYALSASKLNDPKLLDGAYPLQ